MRVVLHIPPSPQQRRTAAWQTARNLALQALLLTALLVSLFALRAPQVTGLSMSPGIASGEVVVINALAYRFGGAPQRGEIIAFRHERSAPAVYLKRVVGLPGERVRIAHGSVYVDGRPLVEPYVRYSDGRSVAEVRVPADAYYVLGDNRANSDDSRAWGPVPSSTIVGKAFLAIWPLNRFGAL